MDLGKTLYVTDRRRWRSWLARNHDRAKEVWLVYYRKSSGRPRIPYNDAVEEALCYGWIDSTVKKMDDRRFAQRFSPRRPKSRLSEMNKERVRRLIKAGRMTAAGLKAVSKVFDESEGRKERFTVAADILKPLKANKQAWENFRKFPEGYRRVRIGFIEGRRRHGGDAFRRSLRYFVKMTAENKRFGMVR